MRSIPQVGRVTRGKGVPLSGPLLRIAFLLPLLLTACAPRLRTYAELQRTYDLPPLPTPASYPEADAVVVLSTIDTEMYPTQDGLYTDKVVHRLVTLLRHVEDRAAVEIDLFPGEELIEIEARVHEPGGRIRALLRSEIDTGPLLVGPVSRDGAKDGSAGSAGAVGTGTQPGGEGDRIEKNTVRFTFPGVVPGTTIEYRYRLRRRWPYVYDSWAVQERDPVLYTHYTLRIPRFLYDEEGREWDWRYRFYRCASIGEPEIYEENNPGLGLSLTYKWTDRDVPAFRTEPRMPAPAEQIAFVRFAHVSWQNWDAVTAWYRHNHLDPVLGPDPAIDAAATEVVEDRNEERSRAAALVQFVQQMGTLDLELGQGSLRPQRPALVLAGRRGDAKDKAVLLAALLRSAGIESRLALVVTSDRGTLDRGFPNWNFNHMLVRIRIGGEEVWVDPTVRHYPLGELPWRCEGVEAVLIEPDGRSEIVRTPRPEAESNRRLYQARITVAPDGSCTGDAEIVFDGEPGSLLAQRLAPYSDRREEIGRIAAELIRTSHPDAEVERTVLREPSPGRILISFRFRCSRFVTPSPLPALSAAPFRFEDGLELVAEEARRYPVDLGFPSSWTRRWSVEFEPGGYVLAALPGPTRVSNRELDFRSRYTERSETHLEAEEELVVRPPRIKTRNIEEARRILRARKEAGPTAVILREAPSGGE